MKHFFTFLLLVLVTIGTADSRNLRWRRRKRQGRGGGGGGGRGWGGGGGGGRGWGGGGGNQKGDTSELTPQDTIRRLSRNRDNIGRTVEVTDDGVKTKTWAKSGDKDTLNGWILEHINVMKDLIESGGRIRMWDPLFEEIIEHAEKMELTCEQNTNGKIVCTNTGDDCHAKALVRAHAKAVDRFLEGDMDSSNEDLMEDEIAKCN